MSSGSAGFITKSNRDGTYLVYSTFIGGTGNNNAGTGIAVDSSGFAYVTGGTTSTDFPTVNRIQSTNHGGPDLYISKLSQDGSALLFSTYLGGSGDEISQGI